MKFLLTPGLPRGDGQSRIEREIELNEKLNENTMITTHEMPNYMKAQSQQKSENKDQSRR